MYGYNPIVASYRYANNERGSGNANAIGLKGKAGYASTNRRNNYIYANTNRKFAATQLRIAARTPFRLPEMKYFDVDLTAMGLNATAAVVALNTITKGTDGQNRTGDRIKLFSLQWRAGLTVTGNAVANVSEKLRFAIFYDKQPQPGTTPAVTEFFKNSTGTAVSFSFINMDNRDRFICLADYTWSTPRNAGGAIAALDINLHDLPTIPSAIKGFKKLKGAETLFERGSDNFHSGALWAVTYGSVAAGAEEFQLSLTTRVRFTD